MRMRTTLLLAGWLIASLTLATTASATDPPAEAAAEPDVRAMTVPQLLAEFHGRMELRVPVSQRRVDLLKALRRAGQTLLDAMRADLGNGDPAVRKRALYVLMSLGKGARPLVPAIMDAASDGDPDVRATAVSLLCLVRDPAAFQVLLRAAHDPSAGVRSTVLRQGREALADAPLALAAEGLNDADLHARVGALDALSWSKDKRAAAYIASMLDDETVLHHNVRGDVRTTHRVCDEAVRGLEYVVNGVYLLPGNKTQKDYDDLVQWWRGWRKADGQKFDQALYEEPELKRDLIKARA
jgi:hypothetical protein